MTKKTVGTISSELLKSTPQTLDPIEIQRATEKEYLDNLIWSVKHAQKKVECSHLEGHDMCKDRIAFDGDFFIAVLLKKEKLLQNVLRNYFVPTLTCPTPTYDQTIYKYDNKKDDVEYLWTIPDKETCLTFLENKDKIVKEELQLLSYILQFNDGTLYRLAKKLNGESMKPGVALEEK